MCKIPKQTLWEILSGPESLRILIPRIQRDYAHGRNDTAAVEVRITLVTELIESLSRNDRSGDLGLIFGAADEGEMILYDGQQRFTTLFLLHWCLAWLARDTSASDELQCFSYNSRLHSRDFCRALTTDGLRTEPNGTKPSQRFLDAPWFCPAWRTDPTVAGMLVVLDLMHEKLPNEKEEAAALWVRLKSDQAPCFSWQKLDKEDSNESLYVKLNSRGRNLTDFEKLKAWLEQSVKEDEWWKDVVLPENWQHKLDNQWLDLFWKESDSATDRTKATDRAMLTFFLGNALNLAIATKEDVDDALVQRVHNNSFLTKNDWGRIFTPQSLPMVLHLLDHLTNPEVREQIDQWANNGKLFLFSDKSEKRVIPLSKAWIAGWFDVTYADRLLFFGLLRFVIENPPGSLGWRKSTFHRWMRLVRNFGANSTLGNDTLHNAIKDIQSIAPNQLLVLDQWVSGKPKESNLLGFDQDKWQHQWKDEIEKARLRLAENDEVTSYALDAAEDHLFLRGQIGFLLTFSSSYTGFDLQRFQSYAAAIARHFPIGDGPPDAKARVLLQQAILAIGDYSTGDGRQYLASNRDEWRNIFRNERTRYVNYLNDQQAPQSVFKAFLDLRAEVDLYSFVQAKLTALEWSDWRKWLLAAESPLMYCKSSRFDVEASGDTVVLMNGVTYHSYAVELRTYFIFKEELDSDVWDYASWAKKSRVYQANDHVRLELLHIGSNEFVHRVLCKRNILPPGLDTPPEALLLREDETANGWEICGLRYLKQPYTPETVARATQDEWQNLEMWFSKMSRL